VVQGFADMEYPMMANDSHQDNPIIQRFVAEHEIAHSWFPFRMGINEHRYGCMDEGWTTAFEYMIGTEDLGKEQADEFFKSFRVNNWALGSSDENQIPIITPTNILSGSAMGNNEYGKAALAYLALKDLLGDEQFRKCLHGFIDRWQGKHPIPWDMFNSFSNIAGKDLNWFWNNWFFTNNYPDLTLTAVTKTKTGYSIKINNTGGFAIPTNIVLQYADKSSETLHQTPAIWQTNQKQVTINLITKKKLSFVGLETGIFVDGNQFDNFWGTMPK
jgi:aminopeptidase N